MPESIIEAEDNRFYIAATSSVLGRRPRVLKRGDTFAVFDLHGDIACRDQAAAGVYHEDTRYLSELVLTVAGGPPLLLGSTVVTDTALLSVDLTNPDIFQAGRLAVPRDSVHILRTKLLGEGSCSERITVHNYADHGLALPLAFSFAADFADIFEVRGLERPQRGATEPPSIAADAVVFRYCGRDGVHRRTELRFDPAPARLDARGAEYILQLAPGESIGIELVLALARTERKAAAVRSSERRARARLQSSNDLFNEWIERSRSDLEMLETATPHGAYPYAGIPWFSTAFGRDGIISALLALWVDPGLARGVLSYLAATQATALEPERDAEPGKILHEMRQGEMAALGEVPFGRYYGSIDGTPLFVMLAAAYFERTGDIAFIRTLWPHVEAALAWMDRHGDCDGDGFLEYDRNSPNGLVNQGWKDSSDSVFHTDGALAAAPIALCEVQAYAYGALIGAATLTRALGEPQRSAQFIGSALKLRERFEEAFWCEDLGTYALALDAAKRPCRVRSSNAGHALFCGIADAHRAKRVAATLMAPQSFSGWGVRTIAAGESRFNPMSYHNGSIWPHDNALIGIGLARCGEPGALLAILEGMFAATQAMDLHRLPELFCGFPRRPRVGPTSYPVACVPQAWASATVFGLVGACLGIGFDAERRQIKLHRPVLPPSLDELQVLGLEFAGTSVDLSFRRHRQDVTTSVLRRDGDVEIVVTT